jgi:tubulysin polyketide synthase-like protein
MTLAELLTVVRAADIRLEARGDRLVFDAPRGALTPELRSALVQQKAALLMRLAPVEFVTLKGGLTIPVPALRLALDLEARGIPLATDADHRFVVPKDERLTADDLVNMQRWRAHLGAIVDYRAPEA